MDENWTSGAKLELPDPTPREVAERLRHAMLVIAEHESRDERSPAVSPTKDTAEAVAELMRLAETAADYLDPPTDATRSTEEP